MPPADFLAISHKMVKFSLLFGLLFLVIYVGLWAGLQELNKPDTAHWNVNVECVDEIRDICETIHARHLCEPTGHVTIRGMAPHYHGPYGTRFRQIKCRASCPCPPPPKIGDQFCFRMHITCTHVVDILMFACRWLCVLHFVGYLAGRFMSWCMVKFYLLLLVVAMVRWAHLRLCCTPASTCR